MELFDKNYSTLRFLMNIVGLWPFDGSNFITIQRIVFLIIVLSCVAFQVLALLKSDYSVQQCVVMCSTISSFLLILARYFAFVFNISTVRYLIHQIRTEESLLQDPNELQILAKSYETSGRVINIVVYACVICFVPLAFFLLTPIILDFMIPLNESRTRYVKYFVSTTFSERTLYIDLICMQYMFIGAVGIMILICTETSLVVLSHYMSGLFRITSYRLQTAIRNASNSSLVLSQCMSNYTDLHYAVDIHKRAIECCNIAVTEMGIAYLVASFLVVVSFSLNLYRLYKAIKLSNNTVEVLFSSIFVITHILFIFMNNYSGQIVIDDSSKVFSEPYNSSWYFTPLKVQKTLLFIMLKSSTHCSFNLSDLFVPCYTGFSTMMSASFSYFTVMYSTQ